jgi:hypothetical protein
VCLSTGMISLRTPCRYWRNLQIQDRKRLLELFPISNLRETWPSLKGTKEEICFTIAEERNHEQTIRFVDENLSCCKQHVYSTITSQI